MIKKLTLAIILFFGIRVFSDDSRIYIKVGEANLEKSSIAVPDVLFLTSPSMTPDYKKLKSEMTNTIINDLDVSNLFTFVKREAYIDLEDPDKVGLTPAPGNPTGFHFDKWSTAGAKFLIRGGLKVFDRNKLEFEVYAYFVPLAKLVLGKKYVSTVDELRTTAHTFADDLMEALTGKKGFFRTKFVATSDRVGNRWKEVYVMDWDGRNIKQISNHKSICISPSWAPNGKTVAYTSYAYHPKKKSRNADLFTYDIYEGKRYLVSGRHGMNSGAAFTPDGRWIYLTLSGGDDPDIYKISFEGEQLTRITSGPKGALNVEPHVSPDGKKVVFSSTSRGQPMIYSMNNDGSEIKRLTFAGVYNSSPVFSPDGKKIAFAGQDKGHFDIFMMNTDGTNMVRLTSAKKEKGSGMASNEDPSFSPDGRHVVFTSNRSGKNQIYIISVDGTNEKRITFDNFNYYKPRWSPYLN